MSLRLEETSEIPQSNPCPPPPCMSRVPECHICTVPDHLQGWGPPDPLGIPFPSTTAHWEKNTFPNIQPEAISSRPILLTPACCNPLWGPCGEPDAVGLLAPRVPCHALSTALDDPNPHCSRFAFPSCCCTSFPLTLFSRIWVFCPLNEDESSSHQSPYPRHDELWVPMAPPGPSTL